jgi:hypothetical protein
MRSNAVGGGVTYFELGVGWCSYDASTSVPFEGASPFLAPKCFDPEIALRAIQKLCLPRYGLIHTVVHISVADRHRIHADPETTFHVDADPDPT